MRLFFSILAILIISFLIFETHSFWVKKDALEKEFNEAQAKLEELKKEQINLQSEINYLANPLNLEKELRSRFNLKEPGEKMIIVVPGTSTLKESNP